MKPAKPRPLSDEQQHKREAVKRAIEHKLFNLGATAHMKQEQRKRDKQNAAA